MREIIDLEYKQIMKIDKGRHGWEIQERTKAAGDSLQRDLHPILVRERHAKYWKAKQSFVFVTCMFHSLVQAESRVGMGEGGHSMPATWKP